MVSRLFGYSLLLGAVACVGANRPETRATLVPQDGPIARVFATQYGGLTHRAVQTSFRVDKMAHVIVGRLGGDGRIEILFPEHPHAPTRVAADKTYSLGMFAAQYDGIPQVFQYTTRIYRTHSARLDSYDGLGNGYVFAIASEYPIHTDLLDDHGFWSDSVAVPDYQSLSDPRGAIRDLAVLLTRGMPYSLNYAGVLTTSSFGSMAHASGDCAELVSAFGEIGAAYWLRMVNVGASSWPSGSALGFGLSPFAGCGSAHDRRYLRPLVVTLVPTVAENTPRANPGFSSGARRPGFTGGEGGARISLARPRLGGQGTTPPVASSSTATLQTRPRIDSPRARPTAQTWAPPIRDTRPSVDRNDYSERANSPRPSLSGSSGSSGGTRTGGATSSPAPAHTTTREPQPGREAPAARPTPVVLDKPRNP